jgi:hypothetical protein
VILQAVAVEGKIADGDADADADADADGGGDAGGMVAVGRSGF